MEEAQSIEAYPHWPIDAWPKIFPRGRLDAVYLHWTGSDDACVFPSYHYCIARRDGRVFVVQTNDPRDNMRDVRANPSLPYAAHTFARNSYALGIAIAGMRGASPDDFGAYPLREDAIDAMCGVVARLASWYGIPIVPEKVMTHAEAALIDGYFGIDPIEQRWDLARLRPEPRPLTASDAYAAGDALRRRAKSFA